MTDELSIEGKQYISSKRASELSGYAQDYVGQLARKGFIDAQRIGGLWYVFMDSLLAYKQKAETYVPRPPQSVYKNESPDTLVSFDGKDYVSAARAAEITGYHQDYVGQLARGGKILSRQVGNRWYVDREGILAHKEEKDDLLGAVQAESVGIKPLPQEETPHERKIESWEPLNYKTDAGDLMPTLSGRDEGHEDYREQDELENVSIPIRNIPIPIRVIENRQIDRLVSKNNSPKRHAKKSKLSRKTILFAILTCLVAALIGMFLYGQFSQSSKSINGAGIASSSNPVDVKIYISLYAAITKVGDIFESLVTKQLDYYAN